MCADYSENLFVFFLIRQFHGWRIWVVAVDVLLCSSIVLGDILDIPAAFHDSLLPF